MLCLLCLGFPRSLWAESVIKSVAYDAAFPPAERVVLELDSLPDYTAYKPDPRHVVVELSNTSHIAELNDSAMKDSVKIPSVSGFTGGSLIEDIRLKRKDAGTYGIIIDLRKMAWFSVASQPGTINSPPKIIIRIFPNPLLSSVLPDKPAKVVVIDPGHGGSDPGAVGPHGVREKDVVLAIARKLYGELKVNPRFDVRLTRSGDYFVPLWDRVGFARGCRADLFISIHANANTDSGYRGASVFYLSDHSSDDTARKLAEKENAADLLGGNGSIKDESSTALFINLNQTSSRRESLLLGQKIVQNYRRLKEVAIHEQLRSAPFAVLKSLSVPSVLLETAFISNADEEELLEDGDFQDKVAKLLAQAIHEYFSNVPLTSGN